MSSESTATSTIGMSAEGGFDLNEEDVAPLRFSGFLALLLGLASVLALVALPMLIIPVLAIGLGLFALRKYEGTKPVGITAAKIGLVLAAGFGSCGFFIPWFKTMTLGGQAEYFARQYLEVVARGDLELAMELKKSHYNRFMDTMSLKKHYEINEFAAKALQKFRDDGISDALQRLGPDAEWQVYRPTRVFYSGRKDRAELILVNYDSEVPMRVYLMLIYQIDKDTGVAQWHVDECVRYNERIVAEAVL